MKNIFGPSWPGRSCFSGTVLYECISSWERSGHQRCLLTATVSDAAVFILLRLGILLGWPKTILPL